MVTPLASRLSSVKPSPSMAAKARVDRLRATGRNIVDFTIGEPDFLTPPHIVTAGVAALVNGQTRYGPAAGTLALREAIVAKLRRENGLEYRPEEIVAACGAKQVIFTAFAATLDPGDEVIIPAPYWVSYPDMAALHGGRPVIVPCPAASGFKLSPDDLARAIGSRTRWLVLNTPNNPTGAVYTERELRSLGEVLRGHPGVWVITDEIYEHFVYGRARHVSPLQAAPWLKERALLVNGMSKAYAMTGWRVGWCAGPKELVAAITLLLTQSTTCVPTMSQAAAVVALEGPQDALADTARRFEARRDRFVALLARIPGFACHPPDGAFYLFPSVAGLIGARTPDGGALASDPDVATFLLERAGVAVIDGTSYGMPSHLRLSFATSPEEIERGCAAIAEAVATLKLAPAP